MNISHPTNVDVNFFDFVDILCIVLIPVIIMVCMTFWLQRQQRSRKLILSVWGFFVSIVIVGLTSQLISILSVRTQWLHYFAEMAASYSIVVSKLDHWKIVAGDENIFSDWSNPIRSFPIAGNLNEPKTETSTLEISRENRQEKLHIPENFSAVRISPSQVSLRWSPVPGATTYRVQWGKLDTHWEDANWAAVYSGAACECLIEDPDAEHFYRVRAETGTPEDDPTYLALMDACDSAALVSRYIASIYTMRPIENEDAAMFIISPETDINRNGIIEPDERSAPIGERYENTVSMRYTFSTHKPIVNTLPITDDWGTWVTAFHPILDPDGNFDGVIGVDFDYSLWSGALSKAKIWPYSFFFILTLLFFGSSLLIVMNQISRESAELSATQLRESVIQLTEAKSVAEAAVRAKGHFLANMSHEIRTPMNAVLGFANIIGRKLMERCLPEEREQCRESVNLITSSGNDLLTIINDILDFTKVESDQVKVESIPISFEEIIENIQSVMRERLDKKENLTLDFTDEGGIPELILSDPTRLRQILNNLIGNAIKFTASGTVSVRYGAYADKAVSEKTDMLFVEVRDTGIGMTSDQLSRLFQPFSQADSSLTRRYGGTGLGLSISKRLAVLLGGDIRVASEEGRGSVFTLTLPILNPPAGATRSQGNQRHTNSDHLASTSMKMIDLLGTKPLSDLSVLVVEDGRVNQIVISAQLTEAGAKVSLADNGRIAIESIGANESAGTPFDVVLMDMQMPIMDGYEATSRLRTAGYARPIVAITAHALSGDCEKTLKVGCDAYLSKPVNRVQLIDTILELCRK